MEKWTNNTKYVDAAEAAKLIRKQLKVAFPDTKFKVRTHRYSGGCSIDIFWTDGPTESQVRHYVDRFEGAHFDGMTDSRSQRYLYLIDGTRITYGCDYVMCHRKHSRALIEEAVRFCAERFGWEHIPEVLGNDEFGWYAHSYDVNQTDMIWRYLNGTLSEDD